MRNPTHFSGRASSRTNWTGTIRMTNGGAARRAANCRPESVER
jgi:hypothetical protein